MSQVDACRHGAKSVASVAITSDDLVKRGFSLEIREGGPTGIAISTKLAAKYPEGIQRRSLCSGLLMKFAAAAPVAHVTFYLDDPTLDIAAAACSPESWFPRVPAIDEEARRDAKAESLGDLNGDGLPEYAITYQEAAHGSPSEGWASTTLLTSTASADCFRVVYQGSGTIGKTLGTTSNGWKELTLISSTIIGNHGRGVATRVARYSGTGYKLAEPLDCGDFGGASIPIDECRKAFAPQP